MIKIFNDKGRVMLFIISSAIILSIILLITHLVFIIKDYISPDISKIKEPAPECADKKCAFYDVIDNPNTAQENASCYRGVTDFQNTYRGDRSCNKSIIYFGKSPKDTYSLVKRRKREFFTSFSSLAGYVALILSLFRLISNGS